MCPVLSLPFLLFSFVLIPFSYHMGVLLKTPFHYNAVDIFTFLLMVAKSKGDTKSLCLTDDHVARNTFFLKKKQI